MKSLQPLTSAKGDQGILPQHEVDHPCVSPAAVRRSEQLLQASGGNRTACGVSTLELPLQDCGFLYASARNGAEHIAHSGARERSGAEKQGFGGVESQLSSSIRL